MELNSINSGQSIAHQVHDGVRCGICRNYLSKGAKIFKEGLNFGVVCEDRNRRDLDYDMLTNELFFYLFEDHLFGDASFYSNSIMSNFMTI